MGSFSLEALLRAPVQLHGIRLGQPVDALVDTEARRALGFVVLCGDELLRFLPFAAAQPGTDEIAIGSALMLLEDVGFYSARSASLRELRGRPVHRNGRPAGDLVDLCVARDGAVTQALVQRDGKEQLLSAEGLSLNSSRAAA
ncbi:MAG TPA: hypothetical protein VFJ91_07920 [Gaiellaceae bacterium]|nr:hypothetical protein [Gaiellaceae bacterium]